MAVWVALGVVGSSAGVAAGPVVEPPGPTGTRRGAGEPVHDSAATLTPRIRAHGGVEGVAGSTGARQGRHE